MMAAEPSPAAASASADDLETLALDSSSPTASTDPLLRPPSSPSSPAADADHDPFVIDDFLDDDDIPPVPSTDPPAAPAEAVAEFVRITVSDPKKHADPTAAAAGVIPGSGSYFSYLITTRLAGGGGEFRVRRRFRDVVALADRLAAVHRGLFVPARPDKSVVEGQVMQRHDFVSQRCTALQRYLRRLAAHPVVGSSPDLRTFLTQPGAIPAFEGESPRYWTTTVNAATPPVPAKAGRDLFGMFKDLKQTVVNGLVATKPPPVEEETDTEFLAHKSRLQDLQQLLTTTSQQAEALVKARDDLRTTTAHMGMTLIKLAKFEREQATCSSQRRRAGDINNFANSVVKFSRSQAKLNSEIVKHLGSIHEYLEMMISVQYAFTDRSNALNHVQSLSADLFSLHTRAGRLESVSSRGVGQEWSRYQKIEGLKETINATEAAKSHALTEYESIKENNMFEIRRFDKDRRRDFVEMLKGFVVNQVSYSDHYANMWAKVAEETKATFHTLLTDLPAELVAGVFAYPDTIDGSILKLYTLHWPPERWQEYEPLLNYCRDTGIKLVACGTPLEVKRTVQAEGIRGLSRAEREAYAPPAGSGFISGFSSISGRSLIDKISSSRDSPFGPSSYLSAQARVVDDYTMSQIIMKELNDGDPSGMLIVVTGASHVIYGSRGIGVPARISKKMPKKDQVVVLLDPERQGIRREGEIPVADFLWYSAAKPCSRNCFDRAEIARVMNAAGRRPEALPQDLQQGINLGVVSPEILQNFFDLEKYPVMSELIHRFQGFRERLLADPKFLQRLAIEEAISITTTLLAQYERRKGRFFEEIDYVLTDTIRGSVVDFFTVWLPAPTISVLSYADDGSGRSLEFVKGLLGSLPDNAFQKNIMGQNWNMNQRVAAVLIGGLKLASVGFISSVGAGVSSDVLYAARGVLKSSDNVEAGRKRTPIWKSAAVYSFFLGTSANLRYQVIAGLVEHRLGESLVTYYNQPLLAGFLSFVARTVNSYWGTQQWVDLARYTGIQKSKEKLPSAEVTTPPEMSQLEGDRTEVQQNLDDSSSNSNQSSGPT